MLIFKKTVGERPSRKAHFCSNFLVGNAWNECKIVHNFVLVNFFLLKKFFGEFYILSKILNIGHFPAKFPNVKGTGPFPNE